MLDFGRSFVIQNIDFFLFLHPFNAFNFRRRRNGSTSRAHALTRSRRS